MIKGGQIINDQYISVIGGANIDIQGFPYRKLKPFDSNPGKIGLSIGGVGRNIAENTARLGIQTKLFTYLGDDLYGEKIMKESGKAGIDTSDIEILQGESTGVYLSVLDETGDMAVAISYMDIYDRINRVYIDRKKTVIEKSGLIVIDTNLPEEIIQFITSVFSGRRIIADTVSTTKAARLSGSLSGIHTIKPNRLEAEVLTGIKISGRSSMDRAADYFHHKGVQNVFISLGADGTYYSDSDTRGIMKANRLEIKNATGAGDAFVAGLVLATLRGWGIEQKTRFAIGASLVALSHEDTINPNISEEMVLETIKEADID
jgi:pseudouridine kinase